MADESDRGESVKRAARSARPRSTFDAALLKRVRYFESLTTAQLEAIARRVSRKRYGRGESILVQGQRSRGLFFVVSGRVKAFRRSAGGRVRQFPAMGPGDTFNDLAAIDGGATATHIEALEPTLVGVLSQEQLKVIVAHHPAVAFAILQQLARRLRRIVDFAAKESLDMKERRASSVLH